MTSIHRAAAMFALALGGWLSARSKGAPQHRLPGKTWLVAIGLVSASSLWIMDIRNGAGWG